MPASIPDGVFPAMITPMNDDYSIDWRGLDSLIEWYIDSGVSGLLMLGQSSEMFFMDMEERLALARHIIQRIGGRVSVVATGTFDGSIQEQVEIIKQVYDLGVDAVVVIVSLLAAATESDDVWCSRLDALLNATGDIPLGLYECPQPYHRLISPRIVAWAAKTNRFHFMKETSCTISAIEAKIAATGQTPLKLFNADTTSLLASVRMGGNGYCGVAANFYPAYIDWLFAHPEHGAAESVQACLAAIDSAIQRTYPIAAKYVLKSRGMNIGTTSRVNKQGISEYECRVLDLALNLIDTQLSWLHPPHLS